MTEQSEPAIPYGIDLQTGRDAEISQVKDTHKYVCPKCRELLDPRRGDIRRPYFAHHPGATDYACPWRTTEGIQRSLRESEDIAFSAGRRLRLFLRRRPSSNEAQLYGLLPPMTTADIASARRALVPPVILSSGAAREVRFDDLLPSSSSGFILLDSNALEYRVEIRPEHLSNSGVWSASPIGRGSVFVGSEFEAEFVAQPRRLTTGQWVYHIGKPGESPPIGATQLRLGDFSVFGVEASQRNSTIAQSWCPGALLDQPGLSVDVVLPLDQAPWGEHLSAVRVEPGRSLLLAVNPPADQDPGLQVYQVPFSESRSLELSRAGPGRPRFLEVKFSEEGASRLLIHWPLLQERDLLLDVVATKQGEDSKARAPLQRLGVQVAIRSSGLNFLDPLDSPDVSIPGKVDSRGIVTLARTELEAPEGFAARLNADFPQAGGIPLRRDEGQATGTQFYGRVRDAFERGATRVVVSFGTLGLVTLRCPEVTDALTRLEEERSALDTLRTMEAKRREESASRSEVRTQMETKIGQALRATRSPVPRHLSFNWIRAFLKLPADAPIADLRLFRYLLKRQARKLGVYRTIHPSSSDDAEESTGEAKIDD
jgi:hypothetical protein